MCLALLCARMLTGNYAEPIRSLQSTSLSELVSRLPHSLPQTLQDRVSKRPRQLRDPCHLQGTLALSKHTLGVVDHTRRHADEAALGFLRTIRRLESEPLPAC